MVLGGDGPAWTDLKKGVYAPRIGRTIQANDPACHHALLQPLANGLRLKTVNVTNHLAARFHLNRPRVSWVRGFWLQREQVFHSHHSGVLAMMPYTRDLEHEISAALLRVQGINQGKIIAR